MNSWMRSKEDQEKDYNMRAEIMDKYPLLYHNYRRPGQHLMEYGLSVRNGWIPLIDKMSAEIEKIINNKLDKDPNYKFPKAVQVKEKFAALCFYVDRSDEDIDLIINEYENRSSETCEDCGKNGTIRRKGWWKTLCDSCFEKNE